MTVWYHVRDLEAARAFYTRSLGFTEEYVDVEGRWARLQRAGMEVALAEGEPEAGGVAHVEVADLRGEADQLRGQGVEVGTIVELGGQLRLLDVFDPDGNRLQLSQEL